MRRKLFVMLFAVLFGAAGAWADESHMSGPLTIDAGITTGDVISQTLVNAAGGSANPYDYTGTLGIMDGTDTFTLFDVNITNANHTGSTNVVTVFDIANITGDAQATETGMIFGSGWDADMSFTTSGEIAVDGTVVFTLKDPPLADAGTTTDLFKIAGTTPVNTTGTNTDNFLTIAVTNGNASAGTNAIRGLQIDGITQDAQITETAINIGNGWDVGLNLGNSTLTTSAAGTVGSLVCTAGATFGGGSGGSGATITTDGAISADALVTASLGATISGATTSINADSNFATNINTGSSNGALTLGGGSGTVAVNSTGWDISTAGAFTGMDDLTAVTAPASGWDFGFAAAAASTAGTTMDFTGQGGGTAAAGEQGRNGGNITLTGGGGSAKEGAGTPDGNGGDVVLLGGARGGATGGAVTGIVRVGSPTVGNATGQNALAVAGAFEVDGASYFDGAMTLGDNSADALTVTGTITASASAALDGGITVDTSNFSVHGTTGAVTTASTVTAAGVTSSAAVTVNGADVTVSADTTGGNAGARNEFIGLPRIKLVGAAQGTNGTTETSVYVDDSPTGEYAPIDADVTEAEGSADATYRLGASSYKALFAGTAASGDGFKRTIVADDLEGDTSIGIMLYPSVAIASGDLQILITDDGGARNFNIGALSINTWNWVEVDISSLAAGTGDICTEFGITLTAQGEAALGAFNLYMDAAYKWAVADEDALSTAVLWDGVISVVDSEGGLTLVEGTDYVVHYETGNDFLVWITNQSAADIVALLAY